MLILSGCTKTFIISSSAKETVIPGLRQAQTYSKYVFDIKINIVTDISVDSLIVYEKNQCYKPNLSILETGTGRLINKITSKGIYKIEAVMRKGNYTITPNCSESENKAVFFIKNKGKQRELIINSFVKRKKIMR